MADPLVATLDFNSEQARRLLYALASKTRQKIMSLINGTPKNISELARDLKMTEANVSTQVFILELADLVTIAYKPCKHGVGKFVSQKFNQFTLFFKKGS